MVARPFSASLAGILCIPIGFAVAPAAGSGQADAERVLPGRWSSDLDGLVLVVEESGRFEVVPPDRPPIEGRWWVDEGIVHFRNADAVPVCRGVTGRYRMEAAPGGVTFTVVEDDCPTRQAHLESLLRPDEP